MKNKYKFFKFYQNNSGGSFVVDKKLCRTIIIEAKDDSEANSIAEDLGIYFNGVNSGIDCDCCGDRWYECNEGDQIIIKKQENLINELQKEADEYGWTSPESRIFYKNGKVKEIFSAKVVDK